jgi:hypothetical protein
MKFHFLVTISDNVRHLFGIRFICSFFSNLAEDHQVTLLHIHSTDRNDMGRVLVNMWMRPEHDEISQPTVQAKRAISKSRELLLAKDMPGESILTKTCAEHYGKTEDILKEALFGQYDAIILGRRASYSLQWMFENQAHETAQAIIRRLCYIPVWICPEVEPKRKNILLCLDGSDNSFRAADHVGYILATETRQAITLFHVESSDGGKVLQIFSHAESILRGHGVSGDRINRLVGRGRNIAGVIRAEVDKGSYAAAALGLHGTQEHTISNRSLTGSTISKLIRKMERAAIWYCP